MSSSWVRDVQSLVLRFQKSAAFRKLELERKIVVAALALRIVVSLAFVFVSITMLQNARTSLPTLVGIGGLLVLAFVGFSVLVAVSRVRRLWQDMLSEVLRFLDPQMTRNFSQHLDLDFLKSAGLVKWLGDEASRATRMRSLLSFEFPGWTGSAQITPVLIERGPWAFGSRFFEGLWVEFRSKSAGAHLEGLVRKELEEISPDWGKDLFLASGEDALYMGLARVSWEGGSLGSLFRSFLSSNECGRVVVSLIGLGHISSFIEAHTQATSTQAA